MMEGMCPSCLHQGAWSAHAYDSADGGLLGSCRQWLALLEVRTAREKVSGGEQWIQGGPSVIAWEIQGKDVGGYNLGLDAAVGKYTLLPIFVQM